MVQGGTVTFQNPITEISKTLPHHIPWCWNLNLARTQTHTIFKTTRTETHAYATCLP